MGYQVGRICYATEDEATNVMITQIVPTIDKDGVLHHPVFNGTNWVYNQQIVTLSFPQCEYGKYAKQGEVIGNGLVMAFVGLLIVVVAIKAVSTVSERDE